jgi:CRISPR system Cascade subunit CasD
VLGLVCSALGAGGEQIDLLARFAPLDMQVISYRKTNSKGEKRNKEPLLRDFQMVGSGYDDSNPWQTLLIPKTAEGKKAVGGGSKMTYRYYLQDAVFAVALQVPAELSDAIADGLQSPHWDVYLGRKTCIPSELIYQGIFESVDDAFLKAGNIAKTKKLLVDFKVVQGAEDGDENYTLNDVPIQFGEHKQYRDRQVTLFNL